MLENVPDEFKQVGREYFARSPETDLWISFRDLPELTCNTLWQKYRSNLPFPVGSLSRREIHEILSGVDDPSSPNQVRSALSSSYLTLTLKDQS